MKKVYHLSTCKTCQRIMQEVGIDDSFTLQDVKKEKVTVEQIDELKALQGSYGELLNKQSRKYKSLGLKDKNLSEEEVKELLLTEYTLLKRPAVIIDQHLFLGNGKKNVEALHNHIKNNA